MPGIWRTPGFGAPAGPSSVTPASSGGGWDWQNIVNTGIGVATSAFGAASARRTNRQSRALSQRQMDFQERMSSTAYQRSAKDLEAAGLNRILALGSPATTPGGSQPPKMEVPGKHGREGIATALQIALVKAQIEQIQAGTGLTKEQTRAISGGAELGEGLGRIGSSARSVIERLARESSNKSTSLATTKAGQMNRPDSARLSKRLDLRERTYQPNKTRQQNMTSWMQAVKKDSGKYPTKTEIDKYWKWLGQQRK